MNEEKICSTEEYQQFITQLNENEKKLISQFLLHFIDENGNLTYSSKFIYSFAPQQRLQLKKQLEQDLNQQKPKQKVYQKYPQELIQFAIQNVKITNNNCQTARNVNDKFPQFNVTDENIKYWKSTLLSNEELEKSKKKKQVRLKQSNYLEQEKEIKQWMDKVRHETKVLSLKMIQVKALEIITKINENFKCSYSYLQNLLKRTNYVLRKGTTYSQISKNLASDVEDFLKKMKRIKMNVEEFEDYGKSKKCLFINIDQIPVYYDMVSQSTYNRKGERRILIKNTRGEKKRVTINLAITSDGDILPLFFVFKQKQGKITNFFPSDIFVRNNERGWMNTKLIIELLEKIIFKIKYKENQIPIIIWDSFSSHKHADVQQSINNFKIKQQILLEYIPPCTTGLLQPLDVGINKTFKQKMKNLFNIWLREYGLSNSNTTLKGYYKSPSTQLIQKWALMSAKDIDKGIIIKAFQTCGINLKSDNSENILINKNITERDSIIINLNDYLSKKKKKIINTTEDDYLDCKDIQDEIIYLQSNKELILKSQAKEADLSITDIDLLQEDDQELSEANEDEEQEERKKEDDEDELIQQEIIQEEEIELQQQIANIDIEEDFSSKKQLKGVKKQTIQYQEDMFEEEKIEILNKQFEIKRKKQKIIQPQSNLITNYFKQ